MYLKELSISGFKSFAKKSELEFSSQVTGIVGPNGSGKSNVAEAFRFVLGEQSVKSMRGKKGEDLIFSGSDKERRQNRAAVSVTLDNTSKLLPVDFDEVCIERVVHRDGQNEYAINGSRVRLKDIQELLASAHIGATGHHIISQGEADRILSSSAKERREMIEDALGLKVYQYKKAESERKLAKTRENIAQVELLRKEAAPHLAYLERQIKKIEKSLALQEELTHVYAEYLKREDVYIATHHDRLMAERTAPAKQVADLQEKISTLKQSLSDESGDDEKRVQLMKLEGELSALRQKRQHTLRAQGQIEGQIEYVQRRIAAAQVKKPTAAPVVSFDQVSKVVAQVSSEAERALEKDDAAGIRRSLSDVVHVLKRFLHDLEPEEVTVDTKAEEQELLSLQKDQRTHEEELTAIAGAEQQLDTQLNTLKEAIEAESVESREAERELFAAMNALRTAEATVAGIDREVEILERDRSEFKRELQEAVVLLGRAAAAYYETTIAAPDGTVVTSDMIAAESRDVQYDRRRTLEKMKIRLEELGIGATEEIEKEYKDAKERDEFLVKEITDLTESVAKLESLIAELTAELNEQFTAGIDQIDVEFKKFFTLMFGGGEAGLKKVTPKIRKREDDDESIEENDDVVVEEGIELDVKLPNKRVRGLDMLSGGERALTSIALIFAMSQVNPPPFIILDETDAALDEANSRRYGDMITALAERSQLILITHNRETMSRAGILYGVTMGGDGISKLLSVKFDEAAAHAK